MYIFHVLQLLVLNLYNWRSVFNDKGKRTYIDDSFQSDLDIEPFPFVLTCRKVFLIYDVKNVLIFHRSVSAGVSAWDPGLVTPSQWRSPPADPQAPSPQVPHLPICSRFGCLQVDLILINLNSCKHVQALPCGTGFLFFIVQKKLI